MELDRTGDAVVAAVAAVCTLVVVLASAFVLGPLSILLKMAPLYVYFLFVFTRKGGPYVAYDTPRNWAILVAVVTVAVLGYAAVA